MTINTNRKLHSWIWALTLELHLLLCVPFSQKPSCCPKAFQNASSSQSSASFGGGVYRVNRTVVTCKSNGTQLDRARASHRTTFLPDFLQGTILGPCPSFIWIELAGLHRGKAWFAMGSEKSHSFFIFWGHLYGVVVVGSGDLCAQRWGTGPESSWCSSLLLRSFQMASSYSYLN